MRIQSLSIVSFLLFFVSAAGAAAAQTAPASTLDALARGLDITVIDDGGRRFDGEVVDVSADAVRIKWRGVVESVAMSDVVRIEKRDGLANGALAGLTIGTALGVGAAVSVGADAGFTVAAIASNALLYTAIGAGIDAMINGRRTLYQRNQPVTTVAPILDGNRRGAAIAISW
jgi:hypothetical protein